MSFGSFIRRGSLGEEAILPENGLILLYDDVGLTTTSWAPTVDVHDIQPA